MSELSFSEDFDSLTTGNINGQGSYTHVSTWTVTTASNTTCEVVVKSGADKMLRLTDNSSTNFAECYLTIDSGYESDHGTLEFKMKQNSETKTSWVQLDSDGSIALAIGMNYTGKIRGYDGSSWFDLQAFSADTWYTLKVVWNLIANTADYYVDGVKKKTKSLVGGQSNINIIRFKTKSTDSGYTADFDDLSYVDYWTYTSTSTVTLSMDTLDTSSSAIKTDYAYFLGSDDGKVYKYHPDYLGDNSVAIPSIWQSKCTDFADQLPQYLDSYKTLYKVRLEYVDLSADVNVTIYISTDGGVNWTSQMKTLGTGDGKTKNADFYFIETGQFFDFKVEHSSSDKEFKWISLYAFIKKAGDYFEI